MLKWTILKRIWWFYQEQYIQKYSGWQFSLGIFLLKRQNGGCNVRNFLFGISPDVPAFKVGIFTSDFKLWIQINEY